MLCALALPVLLGALVPAAAAAEPYGAISGEVTEATSHAPLQGAGACAIATNIELFEENEGELEHAFNCVTTGAGGEYTISSLLPEKYVVIFEQVKADYITQIYNGKTVFSEFTPVSVTAETTTSNIDAELQKGAEISGTVTNAETGAAVEPAFVCALPPSAGTANRKRSRAPSPKRPASTCCAACRAAATSSSSRAPTTPRSTTTACSRSKKRVCSRSTRLYSRRASTRR